MDVVGSEIGQKMRSAIKAKLTELGCYVDDELPDYVMVMVANKRTRAQMEDDLQLFLGDNTELFVNWLHQVLKKLQEVTVAAPALKSVETEKSKERSASKERKSKEKKSKEKHKKSDSKKAKKKDKEKIFRKKEDKKNHKTKKKSKHHEMIRPNIPPLLMNMEKESEPSITDVFAGQILKNHGINLDPVKEDLPVEKKPIVTEIKRPILPIIDPATMSCQLEEEPSQESRISESSANDPKEEQLKEITQIEAKIQGLKQKLAEQLDSMSDDEDFLNIRTEAEELMNDFAEDVFQEISQQTPVVATPPIEPQMSPTPPPAPTPKLIEVPEEPEDTIEVLPQIELKLPKRSVRERLGAREETKSVPEIKENEKTESPERFTPDREPEVRVQKSARTRLGDPSDTSKKSIVFDDGHSDKSDTSVKKMTSKVSVLENRPCRSSCASVVRVRPRPRVSAPASSLLLRAVADAHKSLLNTPNTKTDSDSQVKRALVLPMRRCVEAQKIVIQVPADNLQETGDSISLEGDMDSEDDKSEKMASDADRDEYIPASITKKIINNEYKPSRRTATRTSSRKDDTLIIETINIHNPSIDKDKNTQFIVTMDGFSPNAFLAKKLQTEGILDEEETTQTSKDKPKTTESKEVKTKENEVITPEKVKEEKNILNSSSENQTPVPPAVIKKEDEKPPKKSLEVIEPAVMKKRRASPIVFDVEKKVKESARERERTESASSDSHVTVTTVTNTHKYDAVPSLSAAVVWCRAFPLCRYGSACAFAHPRCRFLAACTRRACAYAHSPLAPPAKAQPSVASHVVPAANYKSISTVVPNMCKFYPNCVNPGCHFYHPKPCRYGNSCANKHECNFYHADVTSKWRYTV